MIRPPPLVGTRRPLLRPLRRLKNSTGVLCYTDPAARRHPDPAESENALTFKKEIPALGEEEVEPRQVDLLEVVFDLREIGVVGQVERQALRKTILHVEADIAVGFVDK